MNQKDEYKPPKPKGFTLFYEVFDQFEALENDELASVIKAAISYGMTGEIVKLKKAEKLVFMTLKNYIDRSHEEYRKKCIRNKENAEKRHSGN